MHSMRNAFKTWIDDFIIYPQSSEDLFRRHDVFLAICGDRNVAVSGKKCTFNRSNIDWCGRVIDAQCYKGNPLNKNAIKTLNFR